jgi:hypothetical protein
MSFTLRKMRWAGHEVCEKKIRNAHKLLVVKSELKKPLGR